MEALVSSWINELSVVAEGNREGGAQGWASSIKEVRRSSSSSSSRSSSSSSSSRRRRRRR